MPDDTNLMAQLASADPYAALDQLRAEGPVTTMTMPDGLRVWLVTRHEEARQALADPRLSNKFARGATSGMSATGPASQQMLGMDPPDHTRLRRLVSAGFTARRTERLEPRIQALTDELLDQLADQESVDLVDAFAFPLPIQVICELLGVPSSDRDSFRAWSNVLVSGGLIADPDRQAEMRAALGEMAVYIGQLIADKAKAPGDDLLSALLDVHEADDRLSGQELVSMVFLLLVAGHETTVHLIANGMYLLLTHPDQRKRIQDDPSLLPTAVEEFLRYESPVKTSTFRRTTAPVEVGGVTIPADAPVLISLFASNRDEKAFVDPDRFDVGRRESTHISFGHGIHFCLGAALARLEGRIAIGSLLKRYPDLRLAVEVDQLQWRPGLLIRGLQTLPVRP